jgi:hypothetical protein
VRSDFAFDNSSDSGIENWNPKIRKLESKNYSKNYLMHILEPYMKNNALLSKSVFKSFEKKIFTAATSFSQDKKTLS